jgi:hypothetical protein
MTLPGFTAELTLNLRSNPYNLTEDSNRSNREERIIPQLPRILDCFCFKSLAYCCCRDPDGSWTCGASGQA